MRYQALFGAAFAARALAHGDHGASQKPVVSEDANWMTKHMAEEHHAENWDASSFFALHDYNSDGIWQTTELQRTYGLMDESNKDISQERRSSIVSQLLKLMDDDGDGSVSKAEWTSFVEAGNTLPDLGTGPGHHGDDEYEYEIHHWEKYHDENTKLEDLTHPEDIEHFRKHEEMDEAQDRLDAMDKMAIVEENIPAKFRRNSA